MKKSIILIIAGVVLIAMIVGAVYFFKKDKKKKDEVLIEQAQTKPLAPVVEQPQATPPAVELTATPQIEEQPKRLTKREVAKLIGIREAVAIKNTN